MSLLQSASNAAFIWPVLAAAAVKGAALLLAGMLAAILMGRASAAARHWVWLLALCGTLTLPFLSVTLPQWKVLPTPPALESIAPIENPAIITHYAESPNANRPMVNLPAAAPIPVSVPDISPEPAPLQPSAPINWPSLFVLVWSIGATLMLMPILAGMIALLRLGFRSETIDDVAWLDLLGGLSAQLRVTRPIRLLQSDHRSMPMTWGLRRATILLPAASQHWPDQRKRLVLLHELAHVNRRDNLTHLIAQFARAANWFNPLATLALHSLAVERERACDDIVLTAGHKPSEYAEELLTVATGYRSTAFAGLAAIAMARPSTLENRMRAILDLRQNRRVSTRRTICVGLVALLFMLLPLAALHSRAATADQGAPATQPEADRDRQISALTQTAEHNIAVQKYQEALALLDQITALDPKNAYVLGIRQFVADRVDLAAQRQDRATQAKRFRLNLQSPAATQPAEATLEKILPETNLDGVPLTAVIDYLRDTTGANIFVNWHALAAAGVDQSTPIELSLHNVKFSKALSVILAIAGGQTKLGFEVDDNVITITTAEDIALKGRVVVIYNVADLVPDRLSPQERDKLLNAITTLIVDTIQPDSWTMKGGTIGTIGIGPGSPQIVVLQTADTQTHIRDLLDKLRQKQLPAAPAATPATAPTSALPASEPSPWKASLANGLTIEVLGITEAPSKDHPWWRPDGSPLAQRPYALSLPNQIPPRENEKARELVVRFSHLPEGDYAIHWTLDPGVSSTGDGGPLIQGDHQIRELSAICLSAPIDKKTTNLTLGLSAGPWNPVWTNTDVAGSSSYAFTHGVELRPLIEQNGDVIARLTHKYLDGESRLVAITTDGTVHTAARFDIATNSTPLQLLTATFSNLSIKDIKSMQLQFRPNQEFNFMNVALDPAK